MFLDVDEDHMEGNDPMHTLIERQNNHKLRYLAQENIHLKQELEDAENAIQINKNMIRVLVEHQENINAKQKGNQNMVDDPSMQDIPNNVVESLNKENQQLHKKLTEYRRNNEELQGDVLLKSQIIEDNRMNAISEIQNLESEFDSLKHKYDRKELILQNLERKLNYYEMYITK